MCDPISIISNTIGSASGGNILPWKVSDALNTGGKVAGGLFDIAREGSTAKAQQEAIGKRSAQVQFESDIQREQTKDIAERRLGGQKGRFAQAGIKASGTANRLLEEQIKQDELDLLKQSVSTQNTLEEQRKASKSAAAQSSGNIGKIFAGTLFGLNK